MLESIRAVARGKRLGRDLTLEEARAAADAIASGLATPAQTGALLAVLRVKDESVDEIVGFVEGFRAHCRLIRPRADGLLDCAGPYDGRVKSFAATIAAAAIAAAAGVPVVLHGSSPLPPKYGVVPKDILAALGIAVDLEGAEAAATIEAEGIGFLSTERLAPALAALAPLRAELGVRTLLHTVEKLLNLAGARYRIVGVFHATVVERVAEAIARLGCERALVVQGVDGSEDLPADRRGVVHRLEGGTLRREIIDPQQLSLRGAAEAAAPPVDLSTPQGQAQATLDVLRGGAHPLRPMVLLNAALRLWVGGLAPTVQEGVGAAESVLDSGAALEKLARWREATRRAAGQAVRA